MMHGAPAGSAKFDALQREKLRAAWLADLPDSTTPHVMIALPSYALDRTIYDHYGDRVPPLENRYLYTLLRAREFGTEVVYPLAVAGLRVRPPAREREGRQTWYAVVPDSFEAVCKAFSLQDV